MIEVTLEVDQSNPKVYHLSVNGEAWRTVSRVIVGRRPKFPDIHTMEALEEELLRLERGGARRHAFWRLGIRNYLASEIAGFLKERFVSEGVIEETILECQTLGYLDDQETIRTMARGAAAMKQGARRVAMKLQAKGVSREEASAVVKEVCSEEQQIQAITTLLKTTYRRRDLKDYAEKQKVVASLARKGFSFDIIKISLNSFNNEV